MENNGASVILHCCALDFTNFLCKPAGMDIIAHIKSRGMTVAAVARMAGVTRPTIYELNNPDANPTLKTVKAVAAVLGLSPSQIRTDLSE